MYCPTNQPVPVRSVMTPYTVADAFASWGMFLMIAGILWLEYQTYKKHP